MNTLYLLDINGFHLATNADVTLAEGKKIAARLLADNSEYEDAYKVEIRNARGVCIWDGFKKGLVK